MKVLGAPGESVTKVSDDWLNRLVTQLTNKDSNILTKKELNAHMNKKAGLAILAKKGNNVEACKKVHKYLEENYPSDTLEWVHDAEWKLTDVALADIQMARRPGGAREMDKVKHIAKVIKEGQKMEPVVIVELPDGTKKIADGYHRTLGYKQADKQTAKAWLGKTTEQKGPWDKEMHEKKLNTAPLKKTASEFGLAKLAAPNPLGLAKRFVGGVTGFSKKKAQKGVTQANSELTKHREYMTDYTKLNDQVKKMPTGTIPLKAQKEIDLSQDAMVAKKTKLNENAQSAQQNLSKAKKDQILSRGTAAVGATGLLASSAIKKDNAERSAMSPSYQPIQPIQPMSFPQPKMQQVAFEESLGLAKIAKKK